MESGQAGSGAVLVGHSMGAYIALLAAAAEPGLFETWCSSTVACPSRPPRGRQRRRHAQGHPRADDRQAEHDLRVRAGLPRLLPRPSALTADWNDDIAAYVRYDLTGVPGRMRSQVVGDAVREDGRDMLLLADDFLAAWDALGVPTVLLRAPRGMFGRASLPPRRAGAGPAPPTPRHPGGIGPGPTHRAAEPAAPPPAPPPPRGQGRGGPPPGARGGAGRGAGLRRGGGWGSADEGQHRGGRKTRDAVPSPLWPGRDERRPARTAHAVGRWGWTKGGSPP